MPLLGPTDRFIHRCLDTFLRNQTATPTTAWVGFLSAAMNTSDGAGAQEITGTAYQRLACSFSAALARQVVNPSAIDWGSVGPWNAGGAISYFGIFASQAGLITADLLWCDAVTPTFTIGSGSTPFSIAANQLVLRATTRPA